jgi:hypothetical protein
MLYEADFGCYYKWAFTLGISTSSGRHARYGRTDNINGGK